MRHFYTTMGALTTVMHSEMSCSAHCALQSASIGWRRDERRTLDELPLGGRGESMDTIGISSATRYTKLSSSGVQRYAYRRKWIATKFVGFGAPVHALKFLMAMVMGG
eukprot:SAG11_NODE_5036_length_1683_cov_3.579686_3_plen_108_part_00